jgi:hypothetical protein
MWVSELTVMLICYESDTRFLFYILQLVFVLYSSYLSMDGKIDSFISQTRVTCKKSLFYAGPSFMD